MSMVYVGCCIVLQCVVAVIVVFTCRLSISAFAMCFCSVLCSHIDSQCWRLQCVAVCCSVLQCVAVCCSAKMSTGL